MNCSMQEERGESEEEGEGRRERGRKGDRDTERRIVAERHK